MAVRRRPGCPPMCWSRLPSMSPHHPRRRQCRSREALRNLGGAQRAEPRQRARRALAVAQPRARRGRDIPAASRVLDGRRKRGGTGSPRCCKPRRDPSQNPRERSHGFPHENRAVRVPLRGEPCCPPKPQHAREPSAKRASARYVGADGTCALGGRRARVRSRTVEVFVRRTGPRRAAPRKMSGLRTSPVGGGAATSSRRKVRPRRGRS